MTSEFTDFPAGDRALINPDQDELGGRKELAENLAKGLLNMTAPEGYVAAIFGPWGSGKTTLLGFIKHYLQGFPDNDRPIIVEFNPWWFSGREDLTISFFNQLSVAINDGSEGVKEIRRLIVDLAELVSHYPHWAAKAGATVAKKLADQKESVPQLKTKLRERLRAHGKRVIVLVDDVDRLVPTEIMDLFRLVKAVADLPNILYLVAFDRQAVASAITAAACQGVESYGNSYLEKMVQLPIELPMPDRIAIGEMFGKRLLALIPEKSKKLFEKDYWREIYLEGIENFLGTPRDVVRLTNALALTLPMVDGEVNPVDFITLEALRLFRPLVYDAIRFQPKQFAGGTDEQDEKLTRFHNTWMEQLGEEPEGTVAQILMN